MCVCVCVWWWWDGWPMFGWNLRNTTTSTMESGQLTRSHSVLVIFLVHRQCRQHIICGGLPVNTSSSVYCLCVYFKCVSATSAPNNFAFLLLYIHTHTIKRVMQNNQIHLIQSTLEIHACWMFGENRNRKKNGNLWPKHLQLYSFSITFDSSLEYVSLFYRSGFWAIGTFVFFKRTPINLKISIKS